MRASKVSVIVPVYNQQAYLKPCLQSLQNQTLPDIEIICVNDGSTDESLTLINHFAQSDKRFRLINQANQGSGAARNAGIAAAQGEYLGFVDADDWVDKDYFEKLYDKAKEQNAEVCCAVCRKEIRGTQEQAVSTPVFEDTERFKKQLVFTAAHVWSKLFLRNFVQEYQIKNANSKHSQDLAFSIPAVLLARRIGWTDEAYYYYRVQEGSACRRPLSLRDCQELPGIYAQMLSYPLSESQRHIVQERLKTNIQYYLRQVGFKGRVALFKSVREKIPSFVWEGPYQTAYICAKILTKRRIQG
ncbi:glycosyltransferase [Candidatus Avelusimicrobium aviculae]|uniref:glycosyltransferase n=1 Tax=Candidatus Avelusimicrobium aviculae TaxID=3416206 RepID=UPI003D0AFD08